MLTSMAFLLLISSPAPPRVNALLAQGPDPRLPSPPTKTRPRRRMPPPQKRTQPEELPKIVYVSNASEFIMAIRPSVEIKLRRGVYNLSNVKRINTQYVRWRKLSDEYEPIIGSVFNLTISGEAGTGTKILIDPYFATVLTFEDSSNITIQNITLGHSKKAVGCDGDVLAFRDVSEIEINDSTLFGSGAHGLYLTQTRDMIVNNSTIYGCTEGVAYIRDSERIRFDRSVFKDNYLVDDAGTKPDGLISIIKSEDVTFAHCNIENNTIGGDTHLFNIDEFSKNVVLSNSQITGNKIPKLVNVERRLMTNTNTFEKNSFDR